MKGEPEVTTMSDDARGELAGLVTAFADQLRQLQARGARWVPAAPTPRVSSDYAAAEPQPLDTEVDGVDQASTVAGGGGLDPASCLERVRADLGDCKRCGLHSGRTHLVFGVGSPTADLLFVGEAPGRDEDQQGEPFVGAAGQLLTRMIGAMGLERQDVYICNIIKCRPPKNRNPEPDEVASCEPFLLQQIDAIAPRMIIALGNFAVKTLLRTTTGITRLRGNWHSYHGIPLMPTFHPAYLLRNPGGKRPVWEDLQQVMAEMDRLGLQRRG